MFPLDPSDIALILDLGLAGFLAFYFALGRPRTWYRDRLGWVIFGYAAATVALLALIVYGIVFGQKVHEALRLLVSVALAVALTAKIRAVYAERRAGRRVENRPALSEGNPMSTPKTKTEAIAKATKIWYKAQRVLRTAFTTVLTVLPIVPQVIAIIQGQWDAAWLAPVAIQAVAINSALTAIIALPKVNAWLTKIGLGSVPKSAIAIPTVGGPAIVKADPKAVTRG